MGASSRNSIFASLRRKLIWCRTLLGCGDLQKFARCGSRLAGDVQKVEVTQKAAVLGAHCLPMMKYLNHLKCWLRLQHRVATQRPSAN
jgi:hypothetical protein